MIDSKISEDISYVQLSSTNRCVYLPYLVLAGFFLKRNNMLQEILNLSITMQWYPQKCPHYCLRFVVITDIVNFLFIENDTCFLFYLEHTS